MMMFIDHQDADHSARCRSVGTGIFVSLVGGHEALRGFLDKNSSLNRYLRRSGDLVDGWNSLCENRWT
jgi:hypothetical protein